MPHGGHGGSLGTLAGFGGHGGHGVHNRLHGYGSGLHGRYSPYHGGRRDVRRSGRHFVSNFHSHDHNGLWGYYAVGNGPTDPAVAPCNLGYWPQYDNKYGWGGVTLDQVYYQNWNNPDNWPLHCINKQAGCNAGCRLGCTSGCNPIEDLGQNCDWGFNSGCGSCCSPNLSFNPICDGCE